DARQLVEILDFVVRWNIPGFERRVLPAEASSRAPQPRRFDAGAKSALDIELRRRAVKHIARLQPDFAQDPLIDAWIGLVNPRHVAAADEVWRKRAKLADVRLDESRFDVREDQHLHAERPLPLERRDDIRKRLDLILKIGVDLDVLSRVALDSVKAASVC